MKRECRSAARLMLLLLVCASLRARAEDGTWYNSLLQLLGGQRCPKVESPSCRIGHPGEEEGGTRAISRISRHRERVARLRAEGRTEEQIRDVFNLLRRERGTGSISGTVFESDGVTPVGEYTSVWAYSEYGEYAGYASIFNWNEGAYVITELSTGNYYVRTETHGRYRDEYYDDASDWRDATYVHVIDGEETGGIDFALSRYEGTGALAGLVSGDEGAPLEDCEVTAYDEYYNAAKSAQTDETGLYVIYGLPTGGYRLRVSYLGSENYMSEWYDDAESFETATVVMVMEPDTTEGIDFVLDVGGAIAGSVSLETGEPVGQWDCEITAYDAHEAWIGFAPTNEDGTFVISGLRTGVYRLHVDYFGWAEYLSGWYDGAVDFERATPIAVTASDTTKGVHITDRLGVRCDCL